MAAAGGGLRRRDRRLGLFRGGGGYSVGSVYGTAFDQMYNNDSLNMAEMCQAFNEVWPANKENPALELVGFDYLSDSCGGRGWGVPELCQISGGL